MMQTLKKAPIWRPVVHFEAKNTGLETGGPFLINRPDKDSCPGGLLK